MKNLRVVFLILWIATGVVGCATTGTIAYLKKGETTRDDVRSIFGEPDRKDIGSEGEVWHYKFVQEGKGPERETKTELDLKITFKEKLVNDYEILVSQVRGEKEERPERPREPFQPPKLPPRVPPRLPFPR